MQNRLLFTAITSEISGSFVAHDSKDLLDYTSTRLFLCSWIVCVRIRPCTGANAECSVTEDRLMAAVVLGGVHGSVGKTTLSNAIAEVLK